MLSLQETDFGHQIAQGVFVIDFSAEWCPPCRMLMPRLERVAAAMGGDITFAKVDAEQNGKLLLRFGVVALPTIIVFRDGQPVHVMRGLRDEKSLTAEIK